MPSNTRQRLQETFLTQLIKDKVPVTLSLLNGVRLQGLILSFDDFCISLGRDGEMQAVYKQEISTISTSAPVSLWDNPDELPQRRPAARAPATRPVVVERRRRPPSSS